MEPAFKITAPASLANNPVFGADLAVTRSQLPELLAHAVRLQATDTLHLPFLPSDQNPLLPRDLADDFVRTFGPAMPETLRAKALDTYAPSAATKLTRMAAMEAYIPEKQSLDVIGRFLVANFEAAQPGKHFGYKTHANWSGGERLEIFRRSDATPALANLWGALGNTTVMTLTMPWEEATRLDVVIPDESDAGTALSALKALEGFTKISSAFHKGFYIDDQIPNWAAIPDASVGTVIPDTVGVPARDLPDVLALAARLYAEEKLGPTADSASSSLSGSEILSELHNLDPKVPTEYLERAVEERILDGKMNLEHMVEKDEKLDRKAAMDVVGQFLVNRLAQMHTHVLYDYKVVLNLAGQNELRVFRRETGASAPVNLWGLLDKSAVLTITAEGSEWHFLDESVVHADGAAVFAETFDDIDAFLKAHTDLSKGLTRAYFDITP